MAILGVDHVVVIGEELETLVDQFEDLGFRVTPGGSHNNAPTHNALVPFEDGSYIELLAFRGQERRGRRAELLSRGGGMIECMLTSNAIELDLARARHHLLPYGTPVPGSRVRPDGSEAAWLDGPLNDPRYGLPWLIQDVTERTLRVPGGQARQHPNKTTGIARLVIAVSSIDSAALYYQRLLDSDASTARLTRQFVEAAYQAGPHRIVLRQPLNFGPLQNRINRLGDGPFVLELQGPEPVIIEPLDASGASLSNVRHLPSGR